WDGNERLYLVTDDDGSRPIFTVCLNPKEKNTIEKLAYEGTSGALSACNDGHGFACTNAALNHPNKLVISVSENARLIGQKNGVRTYETKGRILFIDHNASLLAELDMPRPESVRVKVEGGEMQMWILNPPGFDPAKKWALAYLVHGGPQ